MWCAAMRYPPPGRLVSFSKFSCAHRVTEQRSAISVCVRPRRFRSVRRRAPTVSGSAVVVVRGVERMNGDRQGGGKHDSGQASRFTLTNVPPAPEAGSKTPTGSA